MATIGRVNGSNASDGTSGTGPLPSGYGPGAFADFAIVAWSANLGSDWNAVYAGRPTALVSGVGNSGRATWSVTGGLDGGWYAISTVANDTAIVALAGNYNNVFGGTVGSQIQGFGLNWYIVPEPSSFALAGLGAAALMIFRRRK